MTQKLQNIRLILDLWLMIYRLKKREGTISNSRRNKVKNPRFWRHNRTFERLPTAIWTSVWWWSSDHYLWCQNFSWQFTGTNAWSTFKWRPWPRGKYLCKCYSRIPVALASVWLVEGLADNQKEEIEKLDE